MPMQVRQGNRQVRHCAEVWLAGRVKPIAQAEQRSALEHRRQLLLHLEQAELALM